MWAWCQTMFMMMPISLAEPAWLWDSFPEVRIRKGTESGLHFFNTNALSLFMQGLRRSLALSHLLSHVRSFKITGTKVVGSLMFVQGPIHLYYKPDLGCTIRTLCMCNSSEVVITETHFHPQMEHQRWVSPQFLHPSLSCDWMHVWEWQMARRWCQPFLAVTIYNIRHYSCLSCTGYGAGGWSILKHEHPSC